MDTDCDRQSFIFFPPNPCPSASGLCRFASLIYLDTSRFHRGSLSCAMLLFSVKRTSIKCPERDTTRSPPSLPLALYFDPLSLSSSCRDSIRAFCQITYAVITPSNYQPTSQDYSRRILSRLTIGDDKYSRLITRPLINLGQVELFDMAIYSVWNEIIAGGQRHFARDPF